MRTEYRILPNRTFIADQYLQFQRIRKVKSWFGLGKEKIVTDWCYIPNENYVRYTGRYITPDTCPTSIPFTMEDKFFSSFYEQADYELIPFTQTYPDIDLYFQRLKLLRAKYILDRKRREENSKITYL